MKYSINSNGFIVAERDIYSLGGFIPKGSVGAKVANEDQISQDGDCWVENGDISFRPDVRVKDNAYIGNFVGGVTGIHTDGITEFSGNTLIPGNISVRSLVADTKNNTFIKDSFIGISMDVLCGPSTTTTAFPFVQGRLDHTKPAGTPTADMAVVDANSCFSNAVMRCGNDTQIYVPANMTARILWAYRNNSDILTYSGESELLQRGLKKVSHRTHKLGVVVFSSASAMTPAGLLATGAKILGHISGSLLQDLRPESASGSYVMDNSSFIISSRNFGLTTTQLRFLAGGLYNTNMYTPTDRQDYKPYGTFCNVARLEYTKYLPGSHRTAATRDTYISAYDCPLLRVDDTTYNGALAAKGDLVLRRCIVPKAEFQDDVINGNTYEDIDFSYANEDLGYTMTGYARFISGHKQGIYRLYSGTGSTGYVSHKGNLADTARLFQGRVLLPLDGSIMEQGSYSGTQVPYESVKSGSLIRVRTGKPLPTFGLAFPSLPAGYSVKAFYYLDDNFVIRSSSVDPTGLDTTYPYVVMLFRRDDDSTINVTDFIALNRTLSITDHAKAPEITGSAYVGAGCTVRGDVQLHGDPYVNRVFDVNLWERGATRDGVLPDYPTWDSRKIPTGVGNRFRIIDTVPVEPGANITCNSGYWITCYFFDANGNYLSSPGWGRIANTAPAKSAFVGIIIKKADAASDAGGLITKEDLALANVKYLRAFKKRRYIVNELDRTSPEDILLCPDKWGQLYLSRTAGKKYSELRYASADGISLNTPINVPASATINTGSGYARSGANLDALLLCLTDTLAPPENVAMQGLALRKDPVAAILPSEAPDARAVIEFTPSPRIVVPYGVSNVWIEGTKVRMYDNSVISRTITKGAGVILKGDAVMGSVFTGDICMCSNGHSDAIIKLP